MKLISSLIVLFFLSYPALAEDPPAGAIELPHVLQISAVDPEMMLGQIELKVLLQHYEKLVREQYETDLQLRLVAANASPALSEAEQANLQQSLENATDEDAKKEALARMEEREKAALDAFQRRLKILKRMREELYGEVKRQMQTLEVLAKEQSPQTK